MPLLARELLNLRLGKQPPRGLDFAQGRENGKCRFNDLQQMNSIDVPDRNIKIAIVLPSLAGGGAERVVLSLAKAFLTYRYRIDIVVMRAEGELLGLLPGEARLVELGCERFRSVPVAFARYLRKERPDVVIANMWPLTVMCVIGHRLARSRSRIAVVEHVSFASVPRYQGWRNRAFLRSTLMLSCRLAHVRIAVSGGAADDLARLADFRRDRIEVIHNPIEISASPNADDPKDIWEGAQGKRVLSVGRLMRQKNQSLLLEAFSRVIRKTDARLVILGEGPLRGTLEQKIAELKLERAVKLPGFMINPAPTYTSADLFVLCSDYEGFGNVIVEALACGVPVVSTDCPSGPREILRDGEFGALVPCGDPDALADAVLQALASDHDTGKLKNRALDFTPTKAADAYIGAIFGYSDHAVPRRGER
jgi:glycosyltransferase involved in cell wall biosynthesis